MVVDGFRWIYINVTNTDRQPNCYYYLFADSEQYRQRVYIGYLYYDCYC